MLSCSIYLFIKSSCNFDYKSDDLLKKKVWYNLESRLSKYNAEI